MFRDAFAHRRCLVPANGFYEWARKGTARTPYYFTLKSGRLFAFAGIWDVAESEGGTAATFAILTTTANELVSTVHDRMPVVLGEPDEELWLADDAPPEAVAALIAPLNPSLMTMYRVSSQMNSPRFDSPSAIEPLTAG